MNLSHSFGQRESVPGADMQVRNAHHHEDRQTYHFDPRFSYFNYLNPLGDKNAGITKRGHF